MDENEKAVDSAYGIPEFAKLLPSPENKRHLMDLARDLTMMYLEGNPDEYVEDYVDRYAKMYSKLVKELMNSKF